MNAARVLEGTGGLSRLWATTAVIACVCTSC